MSYDALEGIVGHELDGVLAKPDYLGP